LFTSISPHTCHHFVDSVTVPSCCRCRCRLLLFVYCSPGISPDAVPLLPYILFTITVPVPICDHFRCFPLHFHSYAVLVHRLRFLFHLFCGISTVATAYVTFTTRTVTVRTFYTHFYVLPLPFYLPRCCTTGFLPRSFDYLQPGRSPHRFYYRSRSFRCYNLLRYVSGTYPFPRCDTTH